MDGKTAIAVEACPTCGSLDVRAAEPRWFRVDVDRSRVDDGWVERIEFGCRECGGSWS